MEMVDAVDELKSSRSIEGKDIPNFEMLDARNASALNKIIQRTPRGRSVWRNGKPKKRIGFLAEDRSLTRSTTTFESLVLMNRS